MARETLMSRPCRRYQLRRAPSPPGRRPARPHPARGSADRPRSRAPGATPRDRSRRRRGHSCRSRSTHSPPDARRAGKAAPFTLVSAHGEILQLARARIRGAAEDEDAAVCAAEERLQRVVAQVGLGCHRVGAVDIEERAGVRLAGATDVAALGVEQDGNLRVLLLDVGDDAR